MYIRLVFPNICFYKNKPHNLVFIIQLHLFQQRLYNRNWNTDKIRRRFMGIYNSYYETSR